MTTEKLMVEYLGLSDRWHKLSKAKKKKVFTYWSRPDVQARFAKLVDDVMAKIIKDSWLHNGF